MDDMCNPVSQPLVVLDTVNRKKCTVYDMSICWMKDGYL